MTDRSHESDLPTSRRYGDDDADLAIVAERNVSVLGFDAVSRAHALCLRDSGVDLRIALSEADLRAGLADAATTDGIRAVGLAEAAAESDLVVAIDLAPEASPELSRALRDEFVEGDALVIGPRVVLSGLSAGPDGDESPSSGQTVLSGIDIVRVSVADPAADLRAAFAAGRGLPTFVSVLQDRSGAAWDLALSYGRGIGATRAGVFRVDDRDLVKAQAVADALAEGVILPAVRAALGDLLAAGCPADLAYSELVQRVSRLAHDLAAGQRDDDLLTPDRREVGAGWRALTARRDSGRSGGRSHIH